MTHTRSGMEHICRICNFISDVPLPFRVCPTCDHKRSSARTFQLSFVPVRVQHGPNVCLENEKCCSVPLWQLSISKDPTLLRFACAMHFEEAVTSILNDLDRKFPDFLVDIESTEDTDAN